MNTPHYFFATLLSVLITVWTPQAGKSQNIQPITDFQQIKAMIDSNRFETMYTIATTHYSYFLQPGTPYSDQNIRIGQDSAFVIVRDSLAAGYLPYYGGGYSTPQTGSKGIVFSGKMIQPTSKIKGRGNRQSITYGFSVIGTLDAYKISLIIQNDGTCYLYVNSNKRSPISYVGRVVRQVH